MGQVAIALPESIDTPPALSPAHGANGADDLLSQLAGDEVDRLLKEADLAPRRGLEAEGPEEASMARALAGEASAQELEHDGATARATIADAAAVERAIGADAAPVEEAGKGAEGVHVDAGAAVEEVGSALSTEGAARPQDAPAAADAPVAGMGAPVAGMGALVDAQLEAELDAALDATITSNASFAEVQMGDLDKQLAGALAMPAAQEFEGEGKRSILSWLGLPLEWMGAPFANVPEGMRNAIGKAALLTLVNSLAILTYVLVFRKH